MTIILLLYALVKSLKCFFWVGSRDETEAKITVREREMVVLLQLPRFHASVFLTKQASLCKTHFNLLLKPKIPITIKSTLSTASGPTQNLDVPVEETHVELSLEKLFVPPETDVPSGGATSSLTARILKGSNIYIF
jgi:GTP-binding protein